MTLISKKIVNGNEVSIYRMPIIAGMQFNKGKTIGNRLKKIGYYDFVLTVSFLGETISEERKPNVFY